MKHVVILLTVLAALTVSMQAQTAPSMAIKTTVNAPPAQVRVSGRMIATLRATVSGATPAQRAEATQLRIQQIMSLSTEGKIEHRPLYTGTAILLDGRLAVFLAPEDIDETSGETMTMAVSHAEAVLGILDAEARELRDVPSLLKSIGLAVGALIFFIAIIRLLWWARRRITIILLRKVNQSVAEFKTIKQILASSSGLPIILSKLVVYATWILILICTYVWLTYTLELFPVTRVWGEQMVESIFSLLSWFGNGILEALPNLMIVIFIYVVARTINRFINGVLKRIEDGQIHVEWIHAESVKPTRQIIRLVVWIFAFAFAYPYIPGSESDAFRGVSVVAGLMLSLGASSAVGQALAGLVLMYARTIRKGEYVSIGDHHGTVTHIGFFQSRLRTAYQEEIVMPNSTIVQSTVVNHTRLVEHGLTYTTAVTIGYDAPWRQIHAMLVEAARRTDNVASTPAAYVTQSSLQDFYIEYKLTVTFADTARRRESISALHGNIQDVFNENNVQIMSPHYISDPSEPKVVPPDKNDPGIKQ